jgi:hypothetical protein
MKRIYIVTVGFLILTQSIQSQVVFYFGKPDYGNATVLLTDGKTMIGEVQDFSSPNSVEFNGAVGSATEEFEQSFNFDRKKIKFRKNKNDSFRLIPSDSIDIIQFFDEDLNKTFEFKRLKIFKSSNGEIRESKRTVFLPLFKKDAISLYGYHVYTSGHYATTIVYINNPKDNIALNPYELNIAELLTARKTLTARITGSYKFVSKNCPDFHQWLDEKLIEEYETIFKPYYKATRQEVKEGKKKLKTKQEKRALENQKWTEFYIKLVSPTVEKYKEFCK